VSGILKLIHQILRIFVVPCSSYFGDIFAPTSRHSPWNVIEENYESENSSNSKETTTETNEVDTENEITE
jgi:hypothetical protein